MTKFKIGDRVEMVEDIFCVIAGDRGTVIGVSTDETDNCVVVMFDRILSSGHDGQSIGYKYGKTMPSKAERESRCLFLRDYKLKLIESEGKVVPNFKVGDRVRMVTKYDFAYPGEEGIIIAVYDKSRPVSSLLVMFDKTASLKHSGDVEDAPGMLSYIHPYPDLETRHDRCHFVPPSSVKLIKPGTDAFSKLIVYAEHNKVIAKLLNGKRTVATGVAKCSPSDTFDFLKGAQIAVQRCMVKASNTPIALDGEAVKQLGITTTL